jgi:hypothetical protein
VRCTLRFAAANDGGAWWHESTDPNPYPSVTATVATGGSQEKISIIVHG